MCVCVCVCVCLCLCVCDCVCLCEREREVNHIGYSNENYSTYSLLRITTVPRFKCMANYVCFLQENILAEHLQ